MALSNQETPSDPTNLFAGYLPAQIRLSNQEVADVWQQVLDKLVRVHGFKLPVVVMVAGTNGKGSTCAFLDAILTCAGFKVGCYTSPHFFHVRESIRIGSEPASDQQLEVAREFLSEFSCTHLSPFERDTLLALTAFSLEPLDVWILEVGMGGRHDAVNIVDPDCAILTNVALDHMQFLGPTREAIGLEKAQIFRPGMPAICADPSPPVSVLEHAKSIGADLWCFGRDFNFSGDKQQWAYGGRTVRRHSMAYPALRGANQLLNASAALAALESLKNSLPVSQQAVRQGLAVVELAGRFQVLPGRPTVVLDVAHNPQAAGHLAANLGQMGFFPYTYAVVGLHNDKDLQGVLLSLRDQVDHWIFVDLPSERAAPALRLQDILLSISPNKTYQLLSGASQSDRLDASAEPTKPKSQTAQEYSIERCPNAAAGLARARERAGENDRIIVFGSFLTVAAVLKA